MTALFAQVRSGEGVPLVLLHGFGGDHTAWIGIVQRLPKTVPTLAYDLPGHGRSLGAEGGGKVPAMAKAILADLDARGVGRFHLAGHSMGGATATMMALRAPDRIASLTLLAPGGYGREIAIGVLRDWAAAANRPSIARALKHMTAPGHLFGAFEVGRVEAMRRRAGQVAALRGIAERLADEEGRQGAFPREQLETLPRATLVWGDADPILPAYHADGLEDAMNVLRVPGAGHMLMEERPKVVAEAIGSAMETTR